MRRIHIAYLPPPRRLPLEFVAGLSLREVVEAGAELVGGGVGGGGAGAAQGFDEVVGGGLGGGRGEVGEGAEGGCGRLVWRVEMEGGGGRVRWATSGVVGVVVDAWRGWERGGMGRRR